ncbi:methyltransferase, FxLD system [Streptosporangium saharense]|uniref:methyltransferase, FxLD system n=1 Tax=Streptosporangium saharense TaxID=1706840 RepID=UPI0036962306
MITETSADGLRKQMAEELASYPSLVTDQILAAVRAVPRHLFVPGVPLAEAYSLDTVITHRDERGVALSSSTGLTTMAGMLKQLDVHPGHRVLEIGAGTGFNAGLLRHLVGPEGSVTTIDILEPAVVEARQHLAAAGLGDVTVVHGDGELGVPENGPYDRIIVTAGASDLPPAWAEQVAPGGRLVVPLRINGLTRAATFERSGGFWRSLDADECGFMPMRGPGQTDEHNLSLRGQTGVVVRTDGGQPLDAALLEGVLDGPATERWTGAVSGDFANLDFWLAALPGFARVIVMGDGVAAGLVRPMYPWGAMGVVDGDTLAYLTMRSTTSGDAPPYEIGVCAYGPGRDNLVDRLAERVAAWNEEMNGTGDQLWIEVHPHDAEQVPDGMVHVMRRYNQIIVGRELI